VSVSFRNVEIGVWFSREQIQIQENPDGILISHLSIFEIANLISIF